MKSRTFAAVMFAALTTLGVNLVSNHADAQELEARRGGPVGVRLDLHLDLGWYGNGGVGFRADIPIVNDGLISGVNDDLSISLGAEFMWWYRHEYDGFGVIPLAALQWNFYLSERWAIAPELGVAFVIGPTGWNDRYYPNYAVPFLGVGVRYHFSPRNALLIRATFPSGLQLGITF